MKKALIVFGLITSIAVGVMFIPGNVKDGNAYSLYESPFTSETSKEQEKEELRLKISQKDTHYGLDEYIQKREALRAKIDNCMPLFELVGFPSLSSKFPSVSEFNTIYNFVASYHGVPSVVEYGVFWNSLVSGQNTSLPSDSNLTHSSTSSRTSEAESNVETTNVWDSDPSADLWVTLDPHNGSSTFQVKVSDLELFLEVYEIEKIPGYHFLGWATENGNTVSNYKILGGKTIYAVWADDERSRVMNDYPWSP